MMDYQPSIRTRLTFSFALALAAGMTLFAFGIWFAMRASLLTDLNATLVDRAQSLERFLELELSGSRHVHLRGELDEFARGLPHGFGVEVRRKEGNWNYTSPFPFNQKFQTYVETSKIQDVEYEIRVYGSFEPIDNTLSRLRILLTWSIPLVIVVAALGGFWLSRRALAPVDAITAAAREISIENLSRRLSVPQTGDELQRLSATWNGMLDRLEAAVNRLSQFTADASHELRTPLAVIRATAELAARRSRTPEAYRASLGEVVAEADRMTQLVEDLLFLARCDSGAAHMPQHTIDLAAVTREACSAWTPVAEQKSIRVSAALAACQVTGNAAALRRLVLVLLDNAIKYSEPGSSVEISVENGRLKIRDRGIGIRPEVLPHIFERFYQADSSRANTGYGLGLAQAESIVRRHGASIEVSSSPGEGSTFEITFRSALAAESAALSPRL
jgi:two-component system, OmpR family, heavy metal sensor histidine kinase CusS